MLDFSHGKDLGFLQTYLVQEYLVVRSGSVFYIDSVMTNMVEVNAYVVLSLFFEYGLNGSTGPKILLLCDREIFLSTRCLKGRKGKTLLWKRNPK